MLKIQSIKFKDSKQNTYEIKKNQLENFPLQGGEPANMITTESWNQHGNTPHNALMESFEGELIFIIKTGTLKPEEIANERRKITNICNPLNGIIKMTVNLNDGSSYNRDITFVSAPVFPIGRQNRNREWQKVQLLYSANNPFWYAESEIIETFQGVEPLFEMPMTFGGRSTFNGVKAGFENKTLGSAIENPNIAYAVYQPELPTTFDGLNEITQIQYDVIDEEGGLFASLRTATEGNRPIFIFRYNVPEILERKYGAGIWNGATTMADKIARSNEIIQKLTYRQKGYGLIEETGGNQTTLAIFKPDSLEWTTFEYTDWTEPTKWGIFSTTETNISEDGFATFGLTMTPSDGVNYHKIICDWAYIEFDLLFADQGDQIIFGNIIPSNVAINEGQVDAPVLIEIEGACVNPRIENETTGEFIAFKDLTMNEGQTLVIDTTFGQKRVELDGVNVFNKLDFASTFFTLEIGENSIDFSDETGNTETTIHFIYRNLYITI